MAAKLIISIITGLAVFGMGAYGTFGPLLAWPLLWLAFLLCSIGSFVAEIRWAAEYRKTFPWAKGIDTVLPWFETGYPNINVLVFHCYKWFFVLVALFVMAVKFYSKFGF